MSTLAPHPAPNEEKGREAAAPGDGAPAGGDAASNGAAVNGAAVNGASVNGAAAAAPPANAVAAHAAAAACPQCGATLAPEQEWCLECGHASRRRSLWRVPVLIAAGAILLIGGGVAAAFSAIDGGPEKTVTVATQEQAPRFPAPATPPGGAAPPATGAVSGGAPKAEDKPAAPAKAGGSAAATPGAAAAGAPAPATPKGGQPATPKSGSSTPSSGSSTPSSGSTSSSGSKTSNRTKKKNSPSAQRKRKRNATPASGTVTPVSLTGAGKADPNDQARAGTSPSAVIDGNPSTAFTTKDFTDAAQRPRVGVWVDAGSEIEAKAIEIGTPTPGMTVQIVGGTSGPPSSADSGEYLAGVGDLSNGQRVELNLDGSTFRYYLVWITALGHEFGNGAISEISLYR